MVISTVYSMAVSRLGNSGSHNVSSDVVIAPKGWSASLVLIQPCHPIGMHNLFFFKALRPWEFGADPHEYPFPHSQAQNCFFFMSHNFPTCLPSPYTYVITLYEEGRRAGRSAL